MTALALTLLAIGTIFAHAGTFVWGHRRGYARGADMVLDAWREDRAKWKAFVGEAMEKSMRDGAHIGRAAGIAECVAAAARARGEDPTQAVVRFVESVEAEVAEMKRRAN